MIPALQTIDLGKRYGSQWALRNCTLSVPAGKVAALVGPNGAGKTTLLHMAVGLVAPTTGSIAAFGRSPQSDPGGVLPQVGFVAQDRPLYRTFTVAEMLEMGRKLNERWDDTLACNRLRDLGIPLDKRVGRLSGGQQSQVALVMALAKRPGLLLLDEPVSALDPLARRDFLRFVMEAVAESGLTVLLSSHIIGDLERVCDHLIILAGSRVILADDVDDAVARHKLLVGPRCDPAAVAHVHQVVQATHAGRQTTLLVRMNGHNWDPSWQVQDVSLEEIVLAYLGQSGSEIGGNGSETSSAAVHA